MLNNYKIIKQIFIKYHYILPYSAPVERMFSLATHINSSKINRISDTNIRVYCSITWYYALNVKCIYYYCILLLLYYSSITWYCALNVKCIYYYCIFIYYIKTFIIIVILIVVIFYLYCNRL